LRASSIPSASRRAAATSLVPELLHVLADHSCVHSESFPPASCLGPTRSLVPL
jgi:hypothetical protein